MTVTLLQGNSVDVLRTLEAESVQTCVTSPPYYGLRDYGVAGQIGLEETPEEYVEKLVDVFREVRRVLKNDGTLWLNLGDSYCNTNGYARADDKWQRNGRNDAPANDRNLSVLHGAGYKTKDLLGIPWMVAFALRADGWYLRSDIIWHKPNPMPESVTDRPTKAHEHIFLLTKSARYYYDAEAVKEPSETPPGVRKAYRVDKSRIDHGYDGHRTRMGLSRDGIEDTGFRNRRSVWTVATKPYPGAHFATYPPELIEPCILAGSRPDDTVLDPFNGSGTTGQVATGHGRSYIGVDLNREYLELAKQRIGTMYFVTNP